MQTAAEIGAIVALFNPGGGEVVLVLVLVLVLLGSKKLPELARGLGRGIIEFRKATREVTSAMDEAASDAGRSVGGIYGKEAGQAITPENQVAELYDPDVLKSETPGGKRHNGRLKGLLRLWSWIRRSARAFLGVGDKGQLPKGVHRH